MSLHIDSIDPLRPDIVECPFSYYSALREQGSVYRVPSRGFYLVTRYETAMAVIKDTETFSSVSGVAVPSDPDGRHPANPNDVRTLLTADPPEHRKYRELVNKAFSLKRIAAWEPWIREIANERIDAMLERGHSELVHDFAVPLPLTVICRAMGLPFDMLPQFKIWSDTISHLGGMLTPEQQKVVQQQRRDFAAWVAGIVESRRLNIGDDFVSDLIRARFSDDTRNDERPLDARELASIVTQFLVAGNETTTNSITSGMWLLLSNPDQYQAVQDDPALIPNLVEEVLRAESPVQTHFRVATRDTELDGIAVPAGMGVGLMYGCCNRDHDKFADGDRFDVRRNNASRHLAFGQGVHFCPGAPLARLELAIAFELLLARLKNVRFAEGANDFAHLPSFTHRAMRSLHLEFDRG